LYEFNMNQEVSKVQEDYPDKLERYSKRRKSMSDTVLAQGMMREAFPRDLYGGYKAAVYAAYRFISPRVKKQFTMRRAAAIWNGEARRIDMEEAAAIEEALIEEAHNEQKRLRARLASLDEKIAAFAAASHRPTMARTGGQMGR
jgi:hypothetical protein